MTRDDITIPAAPTIRAHHPVIIELSDDTRTYECDILGLSVLSIRDESGDIDADLISASALQMVREVVLELAADIKQARGFIATVEITLGGALSELKGEWPIGLWAIVDLTERAVILRETPRRVAVGVV